jgi:transcriptional regulator with XRE-family HTH domain
VSHVAEQSRFTSELRRWRTRRRISQLELAIRAGTTQRHVSYVEQGRSVPGRTMVVRLAESLELPLRDRNALLLAAGYAPVFPETDLADEALAPVRDALASILAGHEPWPAVVVGPTGDVIAHNDAFDVLTEGAAPELLEAPVNGFRLALHPDGMAPRIGNFADWAHHVLDALHRAAERAPNPALDDLLTELEAYVPTPAPGPDHLGFAVPLQLRCRDGDLTLITTLTSFATAVDVTVAELQLEAFLPADAASAQVLRARAESRASTAAPSPLFE